MKKILIKKIYGFLVLGLLSIPYASLMASSTPTLTPNQMAAVMGIITNFILDDDNDELPNIAELAIEKIKAYATSNGKSNSPTIQDYLDAGVTGISNSDIVEINEIIGNLSANEVDTKKEIQVLVDALEINESTDFRIIKIKDFTSIEGDFPRYLTKVGNILYFFTGDEFSKSFLWKSDGTEEGTILLKEFPFPVSYLGKPLGFSMIAVGDTLFFTMTASDSSGSTIWKSDGTPEGTVQVSSIKVTGKIVALGNKVYFANSSADNISSKIWWTDGTTAEVIQTTADLGNKYDITYYSPSLLTVHNNRIYFAAADRQHRGSEYDDAIHPYKYGYGLWSTDGSTRGTSKVTDVSRSHGESSLSQHYTNNKYVISDITSIGNSIYYSAPFFPEDNNVPPVVPPEEVDGTNFVGKSLWRNDDFIKNINTSSPGASAFHFTFKSYFTDVDGVLYFAAYDGHEQKGGHGVELWKSDSGEGAVLVKDLVNRKDAPNIGESSFPRYLFSFGSEVYFRALDLDENGNSRYGFWKSDGTSNGTVMFKNPPHSYVDTNFIRPFAKSGNKLFFINSRNLWVTEGGSEIRTLQLSGAQTPESFRELIVIGNTLYFKAYDKNTQKAGLWKVEISNAPVIPLELPNLIDLPKQTFTKGIAIENMKFTNSGGGKLIKCDGIPLVDIKVKISADRKTCEITGTPEYLRTTKKYTITATNTEGSDTTSFSFEVK